MQSTRARCTFASRVQKIRLRRLVCGETLGLGGLGGTTGVFRGVASQEVVGGWGELGLQGGREGGKARRGSRVCVSQTEMEYSTLAKVAGTVALGREGEGCV